MSTVKRLTKGKSGQEIADMFFESSNTKRIAVKSKGSSVTLGKPIQSKVKKKKKAILRSILGKKGKMPKGPSRKRRKAFTINDLIRSTRF